MVREFRIKFLKIICSIRKITSFFFSTTARKGFIVLFDQGLCSITNFIASIAIARTCSKEQFGLYTLGFSVILFFLSILNSMVTSPYIVFSSRYENDAKAQYTGSTLIHVLFLCIFSISILSVAALILHFNIRDPNLISITLSVIFAVSFVIIREYARQTLFASVLVNRALIIDSSIAFIYITGLFILSSLNILAPSSSYLMLGCSCGIVVIVWFIIERDRFCVCKGRIINDLRKNWHFGKWLFLTNFCVIASVQIYPWLLATFHGPVATAKFAVCLNVLFIINPLLLGLTNFIGPKAAHVYNKGNIQKLRTFVFKFTLIFSIFLGIFTIIIFIFGETITILIYGTKYEGNGLLIAILSLSQLVLSATIPLNQGLLAMERSEVVFKSYFLALICTAFLGLWIAIYYGPVGAAIGLLAGNTAASAFRLFSYKKYIGSFTKNTIIIDAS